MAQPTQRRSSPATRRAPHPDVSKGCTMKKLLLVVVLAAICLGLLAAPAFADLRPSVKTAYIVPKMGVWLEVKGDVNVPAKYVHPLLTDAIPANYDVIIDVPWRGITRGLVQTVPLALKYEVSI